MAFILSSPEKKPFHLGFFLRENQVVKINISLQYTYITYGVT